MVHFARGGSCSFPKFAGDVMNCASWNPGRGGMGMQGGAWVSVRSERCVPETVRCN